MAFAIFIFHATSEAMGRRGPKRKLEESYVLDAALELVASAGLDALTIGALARHLAVSPSGLYRYFESKGDLVVALQIRAISVYEARVREALGTLHPAPEHTPEEAIQCLRRVWRTWIDAAAEIPAEHRLIDAFLSAPNPVLTDQQALAVNDRLETVLGLLDRVHDMAVAAGALTQGSARERTYLIWAALHGLGHFRKRDRIQPEALRTTRLFDQMFFVLLRGFGLDPDASV